MHQVQHLVEVRAVDDRTVEPIVMRADVPEVDQDVEHPQELSRTDSCAMTGYLADDPARLVLHAALLELVEVCDVAEGEVVLQHP